MLLPLLVAFYGASKLNNKDPNDRKMGKTLIRIGGAWGVFSFATWAVAAYSIKKHTGVTEAIAEPERNGSNRRYTEMMKILGLPKLPG